MNLCNATQAALIVCSIQTILTLYNFFQRMSYLHSPLDWLIFLSGLAFPCCCALFFFSKMPSEHGRCSCTDNTGLFWLDQAWHLITAGACRPYRL